MKLTKFIIVSALILGATQLQATAQTAGITINISARLTVQSTNVSTNAVTQTVTVRPPVIRSVSTFDLIKRLAADENFTGRIPSNSRIVATNGGIFVIFGTNEPIDISSILSLSFGTNTIFSGSTDTNGLARPTPQTRVQIARLNFDDTSLNATNGLSFYMQGVFTDTVSDSTPNVNTGIFTENESVSMPSAAGEGVTGVGSDDEREAIVSGSLFGSGRGTATLGGI